MRAEPGVVLGDILERTGGAYETTTRLTPKSREDIREIAELASDDQLLRLAELAEVPVSLEHLRHVDPQTRIVVGYRLDVTPAESPRLRRRRHTRTVVGRKMPGARIATDRMFAAIQTQAGGVNQWVRYQEPTPLDRQTVIRMNRDTLYSGAVVDISGGATIIIPDAGRRYFSVMIVNQDHYINKVLHDPGKYELTTGEFGTSYVLAAARALVDPADPADVAAVNTLQDQFGVQASSARPFVLPDYDQASFDATRAALLELAKGLPGHQHAFGARGDVDPVRHLIATAAAWGGLPDHEAIYLTVEPGLPVGEYQLTVRDVPVDGFWSISVYNAAGYFEPNDRGAYSINNLTATRGDDGSVTVHFGGCNDGRPNCLPITDGWNYAVRLYRPRPEILDGTWTFPAFVARCEPGYRPGCPLARRARASGDREAVSISYLAGAGWVVRVERRAGPAVRRQLAQGGGALCPTKLRSVRSGWTRPTKRSPACGGASPRHAGPPGSWSPIGHRACSWPRSRS